MQRRHFLCALSGLAAVASAAMADSGFPDKSRPIRVIAPFGAGSSTDVLCRSIARGMADADGLNVMIDNRPGGEGVIGVNSLLGSQADGYTVLFTSLSTQVLNPHLFKKLPYNPVTDLIPLVGLAATPMMVNLGKSTQFTSLEEFIADAKQSPGKYTIGSGSSTTRMAGEMLSHAAGIETLSVPYKDFTGAMTDLASGQIDMVIVDAATSMNFYKHGVRPIATTAGQRTSLMQDVPTLKELGLRDFEISGWFAAYARAGTPPEVVASLKRLIVNGIDSSYVREVAQTTGLLPLNLEGEALADFQKTESEKWRVAIEAAGLTGSL